jgi:hypothetical protein
MKRLTDDEKSALRAEVGNYIDTAATLAKVIQPKFVPLILLAQSLAKVGSNALPDILNDIEGVINKEEVTPDEQDALTQKLVALAETSLL